MSIELNSLVSSLSYKLVEEISKLEKNKKKKALNLIDKALGVLAGNGVYAYYVYIISQKDDDFNRIFLDIFEKAFNKVKNKQNYSPRDRQNYFKDITENISKLLFLKQLLEKTLIYARYHARAMGEG